MTYETGNQNALYAIKNKNGEALVDYLNLQLSREVVNFLDLYLNVAHELNTCFSLALQFAYRAANGGDAKVVYTADDYRRRALYHLSCVIDIDRAAQVFDAVELWANAK